MKSITITEDHGVITKKNMIITEALESQFMSGFHGVEEMSRLEAKVEAKDSLHPRLHPRTIKYTMKRSLIMKKVEQVLLEEEKDSKTSR